MEMWIEMRDGTYPDGFPKTKYKHNSCESVSKAYPFCPYCGKKVTHIKIDNDSLASFSIGYFEEQGFIVEYK